MTAEYLAELEKTETEIIKHTVQAARALEIVWRPGREHASSAYVRPRQPNGFAYQAGGAGQSGLREPRWPRELGATVPDGSLVWTAVAVADNGTESITDVSLSSSSDLTLGSPSTDGTEITFTISGGKKRSAYEISVEITTDTGEIIEEKILVTITGK